MYLIIMEAASQYVTEKLNTSLKDFPLEEEVTFIAHGMDGGFVDRGPWNQLIGSPC